jgi:hypothetical protein
MRGLGATGRRKFEVRCQSSTQDLAQVVRKWAVFIGNEETNDFFALQLAPELLPKPLRMALFHDEDPVGPTDVRSSDTDPSIVIRACRTYLIPRVAFEKLLGREAANPILAANEQELLALGHHLKVVSRSSPALARSRHAVADRKLAPIPAASVACVGRRLPREKLLAKEPRDEQWQPYPNDRRHQSLDHH